MTKLSSIISACMASLAITTCQAVEPIDIATFDTNTVSTTVSTWSWKTVTDELMDGKSDATFTNQNGVGIFDGACALNPDYGVPGFCLAETTDGNHGLKPKGLSIVGATYLHMYVRSTVAYTGFQLSLDTDTNKFKYPSFKANIHVPVVGEWTEVAIPMTDFSNSWDQFSGDIMIKCSENPSVCITEDDKNHLSQIGIWAQGVTGKFHLEVKAIRAGDKELAVPTTTTSTTTTVVPTTVPTSTTTTVPTTVPTTATTALPTSTATVTPSTVPTTAVPTTVPTTAPTTVPTTATTAAPTSVHTSTTTAIPTTVPTTVPTSTTTAIPSTVPTSTTTAVPTTATTSKPVTTAMPTTTTTTERPPAPKPSFSECSDPKTKKYFILDDYNGTCEETCLLSKLFWYYKTFVGFVRPLQDSKGVNNICSSLNYGKFTKSVSMEVTAAITPLKLYFDVYEKTTVVENNVSDPTLLVVE